MKHLLTVLMSAVLAVSAGCASGGNARQPSAESGRFTPGMHTGTSAGFGGEVSVTITTDANSITDAKAAGEAETPAVGGAALEELAKQIKDAQSAEIDGVTGATMTSAGIREAAQKAIDAATGKKPAAAEEAFIPDGTYAGKAPGFFYTILA